MKKVSREKVTTLALDKLTTFLEKIEKKVIVWMSLNEFENNFKISKESGN